MLNNGGCGNLCVSSDYDGSWGLLMCAEKCSGICNRIFGSKDYCLLRSLVKSKRAD